MVGENLEVIIGYLWQLVTFEHRHFFFLSSWDILTSSLAFPGFLGCHFASFHLIHVVSVRTPIPWCQNAATFSNHVVDMFKSIILLQFTPLPPPLMLYFTIYHLFLVSCCWWGKQYGPPAMDRLLSTPAHYLGGWSRDPFQYFGACMPQWKVLHTRRQTFIIGLRLGDSTSVRFQLIFHT